MDLAVGEALVAALELLLPALDLVLAGQDTSSIWYPPPLLSDLALDLGPEADGLLARLDLRLAADRLGLRRASATLDPAEQLQAERRRAAGDQDADQNCRNHEHGAPRVRARAAQFPNGGGPSGPRRTG